MKAVFIDTGAFLAKELKRDLHHAVARVTWGELEAAMPAMYTSEHILDEAATLLARKTNYAFASEWGRDLLESGIEILRAGPEAWEGGFRLMRKYADQGVSFTDCLSFLLMKQHRLRRVFGFDRHFAAAGFECWPAAPRGMAEL